MSWLYTIVFAGLVLSSDSGNIPEINPPAEVCPVVVEQTAADETERFEKSYPLTANGKVNVSNVNGSIVVEAWDRNEVKFEYTKVADSKERLADVEVEIESRADYFSAETKYDNWKNKVGSDRWKNNGKLNVEMKLMVPRGAVLNEIETVNGSVTVSNFINVTSVSAVNGTVTAENIRGTAKLSTVNGEVKADFDRLESGSRISLETVNGRVNLVIPSDSSATVRAESLNGNITNDFGLPVRKGKYVGRDLYGKLGSGDVQIRMESVNGSLSVVRKNDGKQPAAATDLLPSKHQDDDWDSDIDVSKKVDAAKINKNIAKAVKETTKSLPAVSAATEKALADAHLELSKARPEMEKLNADLARVANESLRAATEAVKLEDIRNAVLAEGDRMARIADASFFSRVPRVEKKSGSFPVKGVPKVTIVGKGCSVTVKGWDRSEVQYRVSHFADARSREQLSVKENHTDSSIDLDVSNPSAEGRDARFFDPSRRVHIEVFVPKKTNLKIDANGTIRLDGVSGDLQVIGADEGIDVRDSDGKLNVSNVDGLVRIVGFSGDLVAKTTDGDVRLDGDFTSITGSAKCGNFMLSIPENIDAEISGSGSSESSLRVEDIAGGKQLSESNWQFGKGTRKYKFDLRGGELVVQNRDLINGGETR